MKKRAMSILLVILLALSCCTPVFAQTYTDMNNHWAKDDMEDLVKRGFLSGYSDNTMQPNKNMTGCELLVMLSRFYTLSDVQTQKIKSDYKDIVDKSVPTKSAWANDSIKVCMASGILTESELKLMDLAADIEKQQLAVFLVRAMHLSDAAEALSDKELSYVDAGQISANCRGSIGELAALEIVKGDAKNQFSPKTKVTRAVVAAMVSRSIKYVEKNDIKLTIKAYEGLTQESGILISGNSNSLKLRGFDGLIREYALPTGSKVSVAGESKTLSSTEEGCYAQIVMKNGIVSDVKIDKESSVTWIQGAIASVNASNASLYVQDINTGKTTNYTIPSKVNITQEGKSISLSEISQKNYVTIKMIKSTVTEVYSMASSAELSGTISEITYGTAVTMKMKDDRGAKYCFSLDIAHLPSIKRGDTTISIDRLKVANAVTIVIKNGEVTSIIAKGSENKLAGKVTSITTTANGTVWSFAANDGSNKSLVLDEGACVYSGKTAILLSDIHIGDEVSVVIYGDMVTEVYLQTAVASSNKVSGRVLNTEKNAITILTPSEKLVYVDTSSASLFSASTGKSLSVSSIEKNSVIVSYGTYKNSTDFTAKLVVVE